MTIRLIFGAGQRLNSLGLAALAVASLLASAPGHAQVPGEAQNVTWCTGSKACLQWSSTAGATQYRLYRGEQASMQCLVGAPLDSCLESVFAGPMTGVGSIPEIPAPGRFYWFLVTAQNGTGEGPSGSVKQGAIVQPRVRNTFGSCPVNCTAAPGSCLGASDCCSSNCAGSCQTACCAPAGGFCNQSSDCCSNVCAASLCLACLSAGQSCTSSASCCSGNCSGNVCVAACEPNGDLCATGSQCCSGTCVGGSCQPGCTPTGGSCTLPTQCCTGACAGGSCVLPTCSDGFKNGSETDVDCGGGTCPPCSLGQLCNAASDCQSQTCASGVCQCGPVGAPCLTTSQCCNGEACSLSTCVSICGNGVVTGTEQCDDGNNTSGDGCSSACTGETGYACTGSPSVCTPCPSGFSNCNGNELDGCEVQSSADANNCGGCGVVCSGSNIPTPTCSGGICNGACATGFADCNGNKQADGCEVNVANNPNNCGACGLVCTLPNATSSCVNSTCSLSACNVGYADCNLQSVDGCEVYLNGDPNNCSLCGRVCSPNHIPTPACGGGTCNGACAGGFADCNGNKQIDGCEVNVASSPTNCGGCGTVCSSNNIPAPACSGGTCNGACAGGFADCNGNKQIDGCEVNVASSPNNCGGCGIVCSSNNIPTPTCGGGSCNGACATGFADCNGNKQTDGCEINLSNNNSNCGTCGHVCPPATFCVSGGCFAP